MKGEIEKRDGLKSIVAGIPDLFEKGISVAVGAADQCIRKKP